MRKIAEIYTNEVYDNLKPLYGNWEPSRLVELGDFGVMRDRIFIRLGNIKQFAIEFKFQTSDQKDHQIFASRGSTEVKFFAQGAAPVSGVGNANARVEVNFSSEDAVFFNAAGCLYSMIDDKVSLGNEIMQKYRDQQWEREWAVITDLVKAEATAVAISGGSTGSIIFEASGTVHSIDLANAKLGLTIQSYRNIGYQVVTQQELTPLYGLCKIQSSFLWWSKKFKPYTKGLADSRILNALKDSKLVETEPPEALYFGQLE